MASRRQTARLSLASAVAAVAVSLSSSLVPVAAGGDTAPFVPRIPMGVTMIRALVSEHDNMALSTTSRAAGDVAGSAEDGKPFDESKLIRLGDVDDNGAADYAYVSSSALHMFLFDTDGTVTSHRAVLLNSLSGDASKEAPEKPTPESQVRKALSAKTAAADKGKSAAAPAKDAAGAKAAPDTLSPVSRSADMANAKPAAEPEAAAKPEVAAKAAADAAGASDDDLRGAEPATGRRKLSSVPALERTSMKADALLVRVTEGCLFTSTECECDLKSAVTGSGTCFTHTRTENGVHICKERDCAPSYVCMCGGSQKCSRSTETVTAWGAAPAPGSGPALGAGETYCAQRSTSQAVTGLVGPMPTPKPSPPPAGCVLDGSQCTCALKSAGGDIDTCATHEGVDSSGRNICSSRTCADRFVCDCAGSSLCEHHDVTNEFWGLGGAAGGGKFYCDLSSKTTTVTSCLTNCS